MSDWIKWHSFVVPVVVAMTTTVVCASRGMTQKQILTIVIPFAIVYAILDWKWQSKRPTKPRKLSKPARPYVSPYVVTFDESEIVVTFEGSRRESVRWDDITFVTIQIENEGFLDIPYWIIVGKIGAGGKPIGCVYSNDAVGGREILVALQNRLPGFNNIAVVQAMDMMSGGVRVWEREAAAVNRSPAK